MTTPALQAEADRVDLLYYWALQQLAAAGTIDALELWKIVPTNKNAATASHWLVQILQMLVGYRGAASELAVSYYRLVRALRTGFTPTFGDEKPGTTIRLEQLRKEFESIVDHIDHQTGNGDGSQEPSLPSVDADMDIELEHVADIEQMIADADDAATHEAGNVLDMLGIENFLTKLDEIKADSQTRDQDIADAHEAAGFRQAAAAARIMMNAARGLVYNLAETDLRIVGWVRYSQTGTPCGWCAMLISRGVVYRTRATASAKLINGKRTVASGTGAVADQDKYHDNCHCVAVPIFLPEQYASDLFALNREMADLWSKYIKGKFTGKEALAQWRYYLRNGFPGQAAPAQAAA